MSIKNRVKEMRMMSAAEISANEKNWRTHPDKQTRALSGILEEIGIAGALLCYHSERNGGALTLIDGHLRKEVAPGEEWPVLITDLTDAEADTLLAVYDPVAAMAGAERERLAALIEGVRVQDARLRELVSGVAKENGVADPTKTQDAEPQIDRAEELRVKWGVETGQLWQLGEHRLICGDCTDKAVVERVMQGEKADIAVTDPPYGVLSDEWDRQFNQDDLDNLIANSTGLVAIFNSAKTEIIKAILHLEPMPERMGVWRYSQIAPKPGMIWSWQPLFYWRCGDAVAWDSLDWYQGNSDKDGTHPTQKPVEFFEKIISSVKGRSVYDPFLGSGTTLIACERLGRKCRAVEISPAYVAVAIQRWADATGKTPVMLSKE